MEILVFFICTYPDITTLTQVTVGEYTLPGRQALSTLNLRPVSDAYYTLVQVGVTPFFGIADSQGNLLCNYMAMHAISGYNHNVGVTINSDGVFEQESTTGNTVTVYMYKFI